MAKISQFLGRILLVTIRFYQRTLSPDHGWGRYIAPKAGCVFYPSCSEYIYQSINKYGVFKGIWQGFKRLLRCNPWQKGGVDPVI